MRGNCENTCSPHPVSLRHSPLLRRSIEHLLQFLESLPNPDDAVRGLALVCPQPLDLRLQGNTRTTSIAATPLSPSPSFAAHLLVGEAVAEALCLCEKGAEPLVLSRDSLGLVLQALLLLPYGVQSEGVPRRLENGVKPLSQCRSFLHNTGASVWSVGIEQKGQEGVSRSLTWRGQLLSSWWQKTT